jgi:hypothetical protein
LLRGNRAVQALIPIRWEDLLNQSLVWLHGNVLRKRCGGDVLRMPA